MRSNKGFTLVELLATILVLVVLAGLAIPLYLNTRRTAAARTCIANLAAIQAAESAYSTRFGKYVGMEWKDRYIPAEVEGEEPTGGLIGAPEGLAREPVCPLNGAHYEASVDGEGNLTIICPNAALHASHSGGKEATWKAVLRSPGVDRSNPL